MKTAPEPIAIPVKSLDHGFSLPAYGLGTWGMGGTFSADHSQDGTCVAAIRRSIDLGVTHIDTAEMYGEGHAEELVGQAIRGYPRERLCLASKAMAHHLRHKEVIGAAQRSTARMNCGYLDLFMVHHPSDEIPITETLSGLNEAVRDGSVRQIGVANFTKERLERAQEAANGTIVVNQVHYSLAVREPETNGLLRYCQKTGVLLVAWQPIDRGLYQENPSPLLRKLCARYACTPVQLALAWVIHQPGVVAICRTLSETHLQENLAATRIKITAEDIETLRHDYEHQQSRSSVYPLR